MRADRKRARTIRVDRKGGLLELLQAIALAANDAPTVGEAVQICLDRVCAHLGWPVGHAYLRSRESTARLVSTTLWHLDPPKRFKAFREITESTHFHAGVGLPGRVLGSKKPLWIRDVTKDPYFPRAEQAEAAGLRAGFGIPVPVGNEIGAVLEFYTTDALAPDQPFLEFVAHVGAQLGHVIERRHVEDESQGQRMRLEHVSKLLEQLSRLSLDVQEPLSLKEQLTRVLDAARAVVHIDRFYIWAVTPDDERLVSLAASGFSREEMEPLLGAEIPLPESGAMYKAYRERTWLLFNDQNPLAPDLRLKPPYAQLEAIRTRSFMVIPMIARGRRVGLLTGDNKWSGRPILPQTVEALQVFASHAAVAIENARLFQELQARNRELSDTLEQQAVSSEILEVISRSTFDLQPVLETLVQNATRLCEAEKGFIFRREGEGYRLAASHNVSPEYREFIERAPILPGRGTLVGRTALEGRTVHIPDVLADPEYVWTDSQRRGGFRTMLGVPMLREGVPIGVIAIWREEVRPFTDRQIALISTFANQAVIAIENVRLLQELQARTGELARSVQELQALAEVGQSVSSTLDLQTVLTTIVSRSVQLSGASGGIIYEYDAATQGFYLRATHNVEEEIITVLRAGARHLEDSAVGRAAALRAPVEVLDILDEQSPVYKPVRPILARYGYRSNLAVPLLFEQEIVGGIVILRREGGHFSPEVVNLIKTFATQSVLAIRNARLFRELETRTRALTRSVQELQALGEVSQAVSSSLDLQTVLATIIARAVQLSGADAGAVYELDEVTQTFHFRATHQVEAEIVEVLRAGIPLGGTAVGLAATSRAPAEVPDLMDEGIVFLSRLRSVQAKYGYRSVLAIPLLLDEQIFGGLVVWRKTTGNFLPEIVNLLKTFATQSVLAIRNARLFRERETRTRELARSVQELQALAEVSQAVSSSLDLQTVLTTIIARAVQLSGADSGAIHEYDEVTQTFHYSATHQVEAEIVEVLRAGPIPLRESAIGLAATSRAPVEIPDLMDEGILFLERVRSVDVKYGYRSFLAIPLLLDEQIFGGLIVFRKTTGNFSPEIVNLLKTFAAHSVVAIQNARLFREIAEKGRQLEIASQHKSQFLANMSHELRTPLNAVLGYTELILDGIYGEAPPRIGEVLGRVQASGRHLLGLINDVLDLSKIEAGQLTLSLADYSIADAVQAACTAVESLAREKHLALGVSVPPDLPVGMGDERRITQALLNLVGNAIKFTEAGEVRVAVSVSDGRFLVAVSDTGPGIAEGDQQRIFEEFQQADSSNTRRQGGTGLGLPIAKKIIELHGGRMWVESTAGRGSVFSFTLPIRAGQPAGA